MTDNTQEQCDHAEKTKRLFFNGRKDAAWVCLNCGAELCTILEGNGA